MEKLHGINDTECAKLIRKKNLFKISIDTDINTGINTGINTSGWKILKIARTLAELHYVMKYTLFFNTFGYEFCNSVKFI